MADMSRQVEEPVSGAAAHSPGADLRVLRGRPTDEELAALVTALALLGARAPAAHEPPRPARLGRRRRMPGSWRARQGRPEQ
jgi:hypothetical protein